jgi:tetratricopeptide (TPR) repeat protein
MTITAEYLQQQKQLHQNPDYGVASIEFAPLVIQIATDSNAKSISDYGAGKCNLWKKMEELGKNDFQYFAYDPVFPEYGPPKSADLVCCIDVLEHVEPAYLEAVLDDLKKIIVNVGLLSVHTGPAIKKLEDGRNAHLIQKPASWWLPHFCERFEIAQLQHVPTGFWVKVEKAGARVVGEPMLGLDEKIDTQGQQTLSIQEALDLGVKHHNAGRLPEAESIYQQVLLSDPNQPVALQLLGVIAHQMGKNDAAVELITRAIALNPDYAEAHNNLGVALRELGRLEDAVACYQKALAVKPDYAEARDNLGIASKELGKAGEAGAGPK